MTEQQFNSIVKLVTITLAGILYILSPIDLVPDFVPVAGWLDDLGVLGFLVRTYLAYKKEANARSLRPSEPSQYPVIDVPAKILE